jgi:ferredoxin
VKSSEIRGSTPAGALTVRVDKTVCSGHARCNALAPSVYRLNEEGYNDSDDYVVPADQTAAAERGALACPEYAIQLDRGESLTAES